MHYPVKALAHLPQQRQLGVAVVGASVVNFPLIRPCEV